jgi:Na+/pantothenate symporter
MSWRRLERKLKNLFLSKPAPRPGEIVPVEGQSSAPVFVSGAALLSFPVACGVIKFTPVLVHAFFASVPANDHWTMLGMSFFVGLIIFLINTSDANKPKNAVAWFIAFAIGLINTAFLLGAAIGIDVTHFMGGNSPN